MKRQAIGFAEFDKLATWRGSNSLSSYVYVSGRLNTPKNWSAKAPCSYRWVVKVPCAYHSVVVEQALNDGGRAPESLLLLSCLAAICNVPEGLVCWRSSLEAVNVGEQTPHSYWSGWEASRSEYSRRTALSERRSGHYKQPSFESHDLVERVNNHWIKWMAEAFKLRQKPLCYADPVPFIERMSMISREERKQLYSTKVNLFRGVKRPKAYLIALIRMKHRPHACDAPITMAWLGVYRSRGFIHGVAIVGKSWEQGIPKKSRPTECIEGTLEPSNRPVQESMNKSARLDFAFFTYKGGKFRCIEGTLVASSNYDAVEDVLPWDDEVLWDPTTGVAVKKENDEVEVAPLNAASDKGPSKLKTVSSSVALADHLEHDEVVERYLADKDNFCKLPNTGILVLKTEVILCDEYGGDNIPWN